jgi:hypothetical protein
MEVLHIVGWTTAQRWALATRLDIVAGRLQRLRSLEVLQGLCSGERGSGFTLPASLSQLTALTHLAVSTDYLGAGLLQLTSLRSLMLHRLQVSIHSSRTLHT